MCEISHYQYSKGDIVGDIIIGMVMMMVMGMGMGMVGMAMVMEMAVHVQDLDNSPKIQYTR